MEIMKQKRNTILQILINAGSEGPCGRERLRGKEQQGRDLPLPHRQSQRRGRRHPRGADAHQRGSGAGHPPGVPVHHRRWKCGVRDLRCHAHRHGIHRQGAHRRVFAHRRGLRQHPVYHRKQTPAGYHRQQRDAL